MSLVKKQVRFTRKFTRLLNHAEVKGDREGFYVVAEELYRHPSATHGHPLSTHRVKLAGHILLFDRNYNWLNKVNPEWEEKIYKDLHQFWQFISGKDAIGNKVAGDTIEGDLVHFSHHHQGIR